ncbi:EbsA family protein [Latilactobacillus graminis]|uniref:Pore-forming protein n=2 Tax=Latilactobacillus graminis TaxID=60519 RepID=A0AA89I091_9LACO|nr:EbsA family protein [Latilactobacillus graminis]KRM22212.1 hypothetical protein FC90_GL000811 [Latilactobacillus graminis DSM 20719]QFP79610.1 hypothetical protein LG542_04890 [Latilactobacillus graminis]
MQKTTTVFYQPNYAHFVTMWSWIGFVYTLALIVQLELIDLNWQSWLIGLIAVCLTVWAISGHRVVLDETTITLKHPLSKYHRTIHRETVTTIIVQKHGFLINTNELDYQPTQLLLSRSAQEKLITQLNQTGWPLNTSSK